MIPRRDEKPIQRSSGWFSDENILLDLDSNSEVISSVSKQNKGPNSFKKLFPLRLPSALCFLIIQITIKP